jgi:predicted RNA-binding Zn-ribbon protein involved in translation (DUF1610 family)
MTILTVLLMCTGGAIAGAVLITLACGRRTPTECATCGYELRGLPSHRCPECGLENDTVRGSGRRVHHRALFAVGNVLFVVSLVPIVTVFVMLLLFSFNR